MPTKPLSSSLPPFLSFSSKTVPPLVGLFLLGWGLGRLVFESVFPTLSVGQSHLLGGTTAVVLSLGWLFFMSQRSKSEGRVTWRHGVSFWPLWLNAWYLLQPPTSVNVLAGWLAWGGSLYTAVYLAHLLHAPRRPVNQSLRLAWVIAPLVLIYGLTLGRTVGAADVFEFQVVVPQLGIVHPTGYPLYLLLGKLWTVLIPGGEVAWRLNVGTAVYALLAIAALFALMELVLRSVRDDKWASGYLKDTAVVVALFAFALSPTFWSQAIEAEIYSLHNFFVALILGLVVWKFLDDHELSNHREHRDFFEKNSALSAPSAVNSWRKRLPLSPFILLAFLLGLGLTNHLTTVILAPAVGLAWLFHLWDSRPAVTQIGQQLGKMLLAFLAPLTLYVYLPLRWQAVNNEPMGFGRFVGWVTGSQFQDALQLWAWLVDPTRYEVVGRLFVAEWAWWGLLLAGLGFGFILWRNWRVGLVLGVTWLGYTFYALNYYVPDLNVFLLPAHLVTAVFLAVGLVGLGQISFQFIPSERRELRAACALWPLLLLIPLGIDAGRAWPTVDQSQNRGLTQWGTAVLELPLETNALILADSEKIAPLYYLQRAAGMRPDLDIRVLPDEAAYRAALSEGLAAGQAVYLARFLPRLEGAYHLRSLGPLTQVGAEPVTELPNTAVSLPTPLHVEGVQLRGYELAPTADEADFHTAVTFYWQATQPMTAPLRIYVRWADDAPIYPTGRHPAHDYYPVTAWTSGAQGEGEIVADYHLLPHPYPRPAQADLQVAFAPPFTPPEALRWQTVTAVEWPNELDRPAYDQAVRLRWGETAWVTSVAMPAQMRPLAAGQTAWPVRLGGQNVAELQVVGEMVGEDFVRMWVEQEGGGNTAVCGWSLNPFAPSASRCELGQIAVRGAAIPPGATNFGDQIALLSVQPETTTLTPGGQLAVTLEWQSLSQIEEDYTVFVQLLNPAGKLVTQVDAWPLQGTYPTSAWRVGETIRDPYSLFLPSDLPAGEYQLIIGFYRLADLQRLPVLGENGLPLDDKHSVTGLVVGSEE